MAIVCFDTHVLIWGIKGEANSSQQEMIERAQALIQQCHERNDTVIVPAVVLGEVLCKAPVDHHAAMFQTLNEAFVIAPYDVRAALINARIWQEQAPLRQELRNLDTPRQAIKTDIMMYHRRWPMVAKLYIPKTKA